MLGFNEVGIELGGLIFSSRVAAVNAIKVSTGYGAYFDVRALRFRYCVSEIPHFRVDICDNSPTRSKLVERQTRSVVGKQQEGNVETPRYANGERRSLVLAECFRR